MPTDSPCRRGVLTVTHPDSGLCAVVLVQHDGTVCPRLVLSEPGAWHLTRPGYKPVTVIVQRNGYETAAASAARGFDFIMREDGADSGGPWPTLHNVGGLVWEEVER